MLPYQVYSTLPAFKRSAKSGANVTVEDKVWGYRRNANAPEYG